MVSPDCLKVILCTSEDYVITYVQLCTYIRRRSLLLCIRKSKLEMHGTIDYRFLSTEYFYMEKQAIFNERLTSVNGSHKSAAPSCDTRGSRGILKGSTCRGNKPTYTAETFH